MPDTGQARQVDQEVSAISCLGLMLLFLPFVLFARGFWILWPFINAEHQRLEFWEIPLIWAGELTGGIAYLGFCWTVLRQDFSASLPSANKVRIDREFRTFLLLLGLGISCDAAISLRSAYLESRGVSRAVTTLATVERGKAFPDSDGCSFVFYCRYTDAAGQQYSSRVREATPEIPEDVQEAILDEKLPVSISINYDPQSPTRFWIDGAKNPNSNRLYFFSFCIILFQAILGFLFYSFRRMYPEGQVPPVHTAPFLGASITLGIIAVGSLFKPMVI